MSDLRTTLHLSLTPAPLFASRQHAPFSPHALPPTLSLHPSSRPAGVIPGEMAEDEAGLGGLMGGDTFDVPGLGDHASAGRSTAGRSGASSYGDIERARRADSVASSADRLRAGAGMDLDADDRGSVVSDMDSDARGRVAKGRKSSLMPEGGLALASGGRKAGAAGTTGVDDLGLGGGDADDYGLGGIMGLSGGDMMMGDPGMVGDGQGGDYDGGGGYDYGRDYDGGDAGAVGEMDMGVAPRTPGLGRAFGAGAALEGEEGDVDMSGGSGSAMGLLTDSQLEQARAGAAADDAVRAAAARKEREASRKVKADKRKAEAAAAAKGASAASGGSRLAEASTILPSETIKEWLRDAGPITRPRTPRGPAMGAQLAAASNRYFTSVFDAEASGEGKARRKKAGAASTSSSVASLFPSLGPIATSLALLDVLDEAADASTASAAGPHTRAALAAASRSGGGGPDGDALLLTSPSYVPVDAEGRFAGMTALAGGVAGALSSGFAAVAACDPAALRVLLAHGSSRVAYPKKTQPAEEGAAAKGSQAQQLQEEEEQQQQEGDPGMVGDGQGGDYDAGGGYDYGRDFDAGDAGAVGDMDLGTAVAVDLDVAGEGLLNADGGIDGDVKGPGSAPSSVGRLSTQSPAAGAALAAGSPGSGRPSLLEAAMDEAAPGSALATGAGTPARGGMEEEEAAAEAAAAAGTPASGGVVSGAKWHATTVQMLLVLVGEMTSPALLRAGSKKRKSRGGGEEEAEEPGVKPVYDLSLLTSGKGTAGDPISFNELAAGECLTDWMIVWAARSDTQHTLTFRTPFYPTPLHPSPIPSLRRLRAPHHRAVLLPATHAADVGRHPVLSGGGALLRRLHHPHGEKRARAVQQPPDAPLRAATTTTPPPPHPN